ncbi:MAG TPA: TetR/AcrR family transcriptional regulator [Acidimicrobiia bacterium]|jgi:AcrR family transcriptional regulator|nr:TetR/AcrR family transcriptional regulator [Acidimicrobiia bacterium]
MVQAPPVAAPTGTRERLIAAAIEVFAEQGYEGARLQDIARAAGLTTGAVYANFRGKAELLFAAIGKRAGAEVDGLLAGSGGSDTRALLAELGDRLPASGAEPSLLVDALAAARRDDDLAALLRDRLGQRAQLLATVVARAQTDGTITDAVSADAFAHFCTMLTTGALVLRGLGIEQPNPADWHALIARLLDALAPPEDGHE